MPAISPCKRMSIRTRSACSCLASWMACSPDGVTPATTNPRRPTRRSRSRATVRLSSTIKMRCGVVIVCSPMFPCALPGGGVQQLDLSIPRRPPDLPPYRQHAPLCAGSDLRAGPAARMIPSSGMDRIELLQTIPLFESLERDDLNALAGRLRQVGERIRATNELMTRTVTRNVLEEEDKKITLGERVADMVAAFGGSWPFIFMFGGFMALWMIWNSILSEPLAFDPLPFMFLNLFLSTLAALQAPIIMMSQNRQSTKDKALAVNDFQVNLKNEMSIDRILRGQNEQVQ